MQIDSSTLYLYVKELNKLLISSQIRQIHQIDQKIFDLELFRPNSSPLHLIINLHTPPIFYISSKNRRLQYIASQTFCMTLRKYLEGARISSIKQLDMDRLITISADRIETAGEIITRTLYLELIPSTPNLILSENDILIDACSKGKKLNRRIIPGEKYTPPENSNRLNFMDFSETELINILIYSQNTAVPLKEWFFSSFNGFSKPLLDELLYRSGLTESTLTSSLSEENIRKLANELISIISELKESDTLHVYRVNGKPLVSPILLTSLNGPHEDKDIVSWMESYMLESNSTIASTSQECRKLLNSLIKKETRKKGKISSELEETNLTETYKLWGNLLSIHSNEKVNGRKSLTVPNLFSDPVSDIDIPLDPQLSINQNSQIYFKKYAKMKTRFKIGMEKVNECEKRLEYLQELKYFLEQAKTKDDILSVQKELNVFSGKRNLHKEPSKKKVSINEDHFTQLTIDGFKVLIGRNNTQNDSLTFHKASKTDLWFHVKDLPGSHVVLVTNGETVPEDTINKTASIAAFYSKGKDSGKTAVDYTYIKYVKKMPNSTPGHVIFTHQKTIMAEPKEFK